MRSRIAGIERMPVLPGHSVEPTSRCANTVGRVTARPAGYFDVPPPVLVRLTVARGSR